MNSRISLWRTARDGLENPLAQTYKRAQILCLLPYPAFVCLLNAAKKFDAISHHHSDASKIRGCSPKAKCPRPTRMQRGGSLHKSQRGQGTRKRASRFAFSFLIGSSTQLPPNSIDCIPVSDLHHPNGRERGGRHWEYEDPVRILHSSLCRPI